MIEIISQVINTVALVAIAYMVFRLMKKSK